MTRVIILILTSGSLIVGGILHSPSVTATKNRSETQATSPMPGWSLGPNLNQERIGHTATLLPNGKVLVAGGEKLAAKTAELFDPDTRTWNKTGDLNTGRFFHTATLLPNDKVLLVGGCSTPSCAPALNSAELYDPVTESWSSTGNLNTPRSSASATLLPNGKVLVVGGVGDGRALNSAELFDPGTGMWTSTGNLISARVGHASTRMANRKVLVAGGGNNGYVNTAEVYDPMSGVWSSAGNLNTPRVYGSAALLPNGKVLLVGGWSFP